MGISRGAVPPGADRFSYPSGVDPAEVGRIINDPRRIAIAPGDIALYGAHQRSAADFVVVYRFVHGARIMTDAQAVRATVQDFYPGLAQPERLLRGTI